MSVARARWHAGVGNAEPEVTTVLLNITAAVTTTDLCRYPSLVAFSAIADQATINTFLGTTSEFDYLAFDATALNADLVGIILNMGGQVAELYCMVAQCWSNTGGSDFVTRFCQDSATLTASSNTTECAKGANGNIAGRVLFGNSPDFDGLTAGLIKLDFYWRSK